MNSGSTWSPARPLRCCGHLLVRWSGAVLQSPWSFACQSAVLGRSHKFMIVMPLMTVNDSCAQVKRSCRFRTWQALRLAIHVMEAARASRLSVSIGALVASRPSAVRHTAVLHGMVTLRGLSTSEGLIVRCVLKAPVLSLAVTALGLSNRQYPDSAVIHTIWYQHYPCGRCRWGSRYEAMDTPLPSINVDHG